MSEFFKKSPLF